LWHTSHAMDVNHNCGHQAKHYFTKVETQYNMIVRRWFGVFAVEINCAPAT